MANTKMGFEGTIAYGEHGTTAAIPMGNVGDINEDFGTSEGPTTTRGDGSIAPLETGRVCSRTYALDWQMLNKANDTTLAALIAAAVTGTPVAIRTKSHATGKGFDGDMNIKFKRGMPLNGQATYAFVGSPNDDDRTPLLDI